MDSMIDVKPAQAEATHVANAVLDGKLLIVSVAF
jgi:pyruvate kinase